MGYKDICLNCKIAFNRGANYETPIKQNCPNCSGNLTQVDHKFQPPKKKDLKKWEVVSFLISKGFYFDHVYKEIEPGVLIQVGKLPNNMREAKEFIELYKK